MLSVFNTAIRKRVRVRVRVREGVRVRVRVGVGLGNPTPSQLLVRSVLFVADSPTRTPGADVQRARAACLVEQLSSTVRVTKRRRVDSRRDAETQGRREAGKKKGSKRRRLRVGASVAGLQRPAYYQRTTQPELRSFFPAYRFLQPPASSLQPSAHRLQPSAHRVPATAFRPPPTAHRLPPSAFSLQPSAFSLSPTSRCWRGDLRSARENACVGRRRRYRCGPNSRGSI